MSNDSQEVIYWVPKGASPGYGYGPGYVWWPQIPNQATSSPAAQGPVDATCSTVATPRSTEVPEPSDDAQSAGRRLSASAARRLRRRRAAERSRSGAQNEGWYDRSSKTNFPHEMSVEELREDFRRDATQGLELLRGQVWRLSRDAAGCRLVQEALDLGSRGAIELAHELEGHVLEAAMCPHANYVVQKVVSHLSVASSSFVASELQRHAVKAAKHRFACRIFCRLLEFCGTGPTSRLVDELLENPEEKLCTHSFAHHVIQSILEHGEERHKKIIAQMLMEDLWKHSTHKNSSYLIEKALCYCDEEDQRRLVGELGRPQVLLDLALTQYGSFVARALLQDTRVNADVALRHIQERLADLEATKHGHRFLVDVGLAQ